MNEGVTVSTNEGVAASTKEGVVESTRDGVTPSTSMQVTVLMEVYVTQTTTERVSKAASMSERKRASSYETDMVTMNEAERVTKNEAEGVTKNEAEGVTTNEAEIKDGVTVTETAHSNKPFFWNKCQEWWGWALVTKSTATFQHFAMISQLPSKLNGEIQDIRQNEYWRTKDEVHEVVLQSLVNKSDIRNALAQWMATNVSRAVTNRLYPDEGILLDIQKSMMVALVVGDPDAIKTALRVYESMLFELKGQNQDGFLGVPPPRNIFQQNGSVVAMFNVDAEGNHIDLSDLSDLTDLSESEDDAVGEVRSRGGTVTEQEGGVNGDYDMHLRQALTWKEAFRKARWQVIGLTPEEEVSPTVTDGVVAALREMKKIGRSQYMTESFRRAIKESGLAEAIATISHSNFTILNRNVRILWLAHVYRIGDQLAGILEKWTPPKIVQSWGVEPTRFIATRTGGKAIQTPADFIEVFNDHPDLSNFRYNYDRWLGNLLEHLEYDVTKFNKERELDNFYGRLIWLIHEWCIQPQHTYEGDTKPTIEVKKFKSNRPHITRGLTDEDGEALLENLREEITGAGVTMVPESDRVKPNPVKDKTEGSGGRHGHKRHQPVGTGRLYHPDSIGETDPFKLDELQAEHSIIARCGHQLLLVLDKLEEPATLDETVVDWDKFRKEEIIDFMWWMPFAPDKLALLQDAVVESTGVHSVTRGGQFQSFMGGKMTPVGARSPSGGRAADTYTSYAGLDATTEEGLNILFKQAAVKQTSVMMQEAAFQVHPQLARELKRITTECDRLGMTGANIFNCSGYMAPIHRDKDASRGLCTQALLSADTRYREFSFCNIEYQYYIVTKTNCLCRSVAYNRSAAAVNIYRTEVDAMGIHKPGRTDTKLEWNSSQIRKILWKRVQGGVPVVEGQEETQSIEADRVAGEEEAAGEEVEGGVPQLWRGPKWVARVIADVEAGLQ
ncbi:hypothetical protein F5880DRAFT_1510243 [Lentinula raphanica]|nr:hypothetical protein F5880DRAFT_1510243 [Lentinula raphanica]